MILLSTLLLSIFVTMALIPVFNRLAARLHALDVPDWRKVHSQPIPRTGGLAMAIGTLASAFLWMRPDSFTHAYLIGAGIIVTLGILDDTRGVDYWVKFAGQLAAALVMLFLGGIKIKALGTLLPEAVMLPDWLAIPLTLLIIVGVTNAINLADGLDGLAGGICLLSLSCIGYLAYLEGNTLVLLLALSLSGAIFGFLRFNTYPATVFMGDTGSQLIGFSLIALALNFTQGRTPLSPLLPLLIIGFPLLDTATVIARRVLGPGVVSYRSRIGDLPAAGRFRDRCTRVPVLLGLVHSLGIRFRLARLSRGIGSRRAKAVAPETQGHSG
ncbi:MAG: MraY family glycosyltransferase [Syntrophorhabdales bacterium]